MGLRDVKHIIYGDSFTQRCGEVSPSRYRLSYLADLLRRMIFKVHCFSVCAAQLLNGLINTTEVSNKRR